MLAPPCPAVPRRFATPACAAAKMDPKVAAFRIDGLCAAPFTPCTAEGGVNHAAVAEHVAELVRQGVRYAFVAGTTGEG